MKVFRFMSKKEFEDYMKGIDLYNNKQHEGRTNSVGFCFLDSNEYKPKDAIRFLSGIVSMDYCVEFEVIEPLKETYGIYAKPITETGNVTFDIFNLLQNYNEKFITKEYCTEFYNKDNLKIIRYANNIKETWLKDFKLDENKDFDWVVVSNEN